MKTLIGKRMWESCGSCSALQNKALYFTNYYHFYSVGAEVMIHYHVLGVQVFTTSAVRQQNWKFCYSKWLWTPFAKFPFPPPARMVTNCIIHCIIFWSLKAEQLEIHDDYYICKSNLSVNKAAEIYFHIYKSCLVVWSCASTCIVVKEDSLWDVTLCCLVTIHI